MKSRSWSAVASSDRVLGSIARRSAKELESPPPKWGEADARLRAAGGGPVVLKFWRRVGNAAHQSSARQIVLHPNPPPIVGEGTRSARSSGGWRTCCSEILRRV